MNIDYTQHFNLLQFPTGRRLFVLYRMKEAAKTWEIGGVVSLIQAAIEHDEALRKKEKVFRSGPGRKHKQGAKDIDGMLDRNLSALDSVLSAHINAGDKDDPFAKLAFGIREALFPKGVGSVTAGAYVSQYADVVLLLKEIEESEIKVGLETLGLSRFVDRIGEINEVYGKHLASRTPEDVTFKQIRELRRIGQQKMIQILFVVIGYFFGESEFETKVRSAFLWPVLEQNKDLKASNRRGRDATDIDPDNGEEIEVFDDEIDTPESDDAPVEVVTEITSADEFPGDPVSEVAGPS